MMDVDTIIIDDTKYMLVSKIDGYVYLANVENPKDFIIQKEIAKDNEKYLMPIETREEFDKALELFTK